MPIQTRARVYDTPVASKKTATPSSSAKKSLRSQTVPEDNTPSASQLTHSPELGLGSVPDEQNTMGQATSSLSRSGKRKSQVDDDQDGEGDAAAAAAAAAVQDESPSTKKQKLAVRPKRSTPSRTHKSFTIEAPVSSLRGTKPEAEAAGEDEIAAAVTASAEVVTPAPSKSKRIIFSDDEPMEFYTPLEAPAKTPRKTPAKQAASVVPETVAEAAEEQEGESDDDEAPEAVSTHKPAGSNKTARAATKAAEQEKKRKRQERDALFKQQAEVRKRAEEAKQPAEKASPEPDSDAIDAKEPAVAATAAGAAGNVTRQLASGAVGGRKRAEKRSLPSILPAEFLESDEEDDEGALAAAGLARQPKKIKFTEAEKHLARDGRPPADQRVGSTVYRVLHDRADKKLAPKLQKHSRNAKEELLHRNRVAQRKKGGFFVNK